ncbi:MAG: TraR/DksA C4-type zinc finger protein [Actinobacteria bacterium]|nr:TraR/DksA C4-type zinc finger protein [Actinomycetota bacterium]
MATPDSDLDALATLRQLRADLLARSEELSVTADDPLAYDDNFADSGQVAAELGENQAAIAAAREQLDEIDAALARIEAGTYGSCETCGGPIGTARLEAMPAARFCIEHA